MKTDCSNIYLLSFTVGADSGLAIVTAYSERDALQVLRNSGKWNGFPDKYVLIESKDLGMSTTITSALLIESYTNALGAFDAFLSVIRKYKGDKGDRGEKGLPFTYADFTEEQLAGLKGPKGDKGDKGNKGDKGEKGDKGNTGATGPQGPQGIKGETGSQGPKGDKGDTGATGPTGPKGDKGDKGNKGDKGDKGDTGATGPKGDKGDQGIQGIQGPKGDKGDKGDKGEQGIQGEKGDTGDAAGFGTVTATVDANVGTPSVEVSSSGPNTAKQFSFAFHNLKGVKGDTGAAAGFGQASASVDANVGTPSVTVTVTGPDTAKIFTFEFHNLKGEKGDTTSASWGTISGNIQDQTDLIALISAIPGLEIVVVNSLPTASAETMSKIYLAPSADPQTQNVKDEYITIRSGSEDAYTYAWEQIGSTAIDLSDYVTDSELASALANYVLSSNITDVLRYSSQSLSDAQKTQARTNIGAGTYSKPSGGIPSSDMESAVQTSLGKADSALQSADFTDYTDAELQTAIDTAFANL